MHACTFVSSYIRNNWYHPVFSISQIVELLISIHMMSVWCVCYLWFQWPAAAILIFWVKFGTLMEDVARWVEWRTKFVVHFNTPPQTSPALGSVLVRRTSAKPLPEPMLTHCQLDPYEQGSVKFESKYRTFHSRKCIWNGRLRNGGHFV